MHAVGPFIRGEQMVRKTKYDYYDDRFKSTVVELSALRECATAGKLKRITQPHEIDSTLDRLMEKRWVVYSKHGLNHTQYSLCQLVRRHSPTDIYLPCWAQQIKA